MIQSSLETTISDSTLSWAVQSRLSNWNTRLSTTMTTWTVKTSLTTTCLSLWKATSLTTRRWTYLTTTMLKIAWTAMKLAEMIMVRASSPKVIQWPWIILRKSKKKASTILLIFSKSLISKSWKTISCLPIKIMTTLISMSILNTSLKEKSQILNPNLMRLKPKTQVKTQIALLQLTIQPLMIMLWIPQQLKVEVRDVIYMHNGITRSLANHILIENFYMTHTKAIMLSSPDSLLLEVWRSQTLTGTCLLRSTTISRLMHCSYQQ